MNGVFRAHVPSGSPNCAAPAPETSCSLRYLCPFSTHRKGGKRLQRSCGAPKHNSVAVTTGDPSHRAGPWWMNWGTKGLKERTGPSPLLDRLARDRGDMTGTEREAALWAAVRHHQHLSHHGSNDGGCLQYYTPEAPPYV